MMPSQNNNLPGEILLYQTQDGSTRIDVRLEEETSMAHSSSNDGAFSNYKAKH